MRIVKKQEIKIDWYGKYDIREGYSIMTTKGTLIKCIVVPKDYSESFISNNLSIVRIREGKYNSYILLEYFKSAIEKMMLENITSGFTRKVIKAKALEELDIPECSLNKQKNFGNRIKENEESY